MPAPPTPPTTARTQTKEVNDPSNSVYKVCYELSDGSDQGQGKAYFPHWGTGTGEFSLSDGKLWQQKYKSGYNGKGAVILPVSTSSITTRFDAAGDNNDTWGYKDFFVRMALCDPTAPTVLGDPVVAPGPYGYGNTVYVSVPFSEMVKVSGTPTLNTSWGTLNYTAGSGSNVLTFSGAINADFGASLTVRSLSGTITDLAGNALSSTSVSKDFSCTVGLPWGGSGSASDPYIITTAAQLNYLAARVRANIGSDDFSGKYFELGADIAYTHTTSWDEYPPNNPENNFTPIGGWGRSFRGNFDGKGHTISGIRVYKDVAGSNHDDECIGLFGNVYGGSVSNIVLRDCNFQGEKQVGGIAGALSSCSVTNCTLYHVLAGATVKGTASNRELGAVVGHIDTNGTVNVTGCCYRDCRIAHYAYTGNGPTSSFDYYNNRVDNVYTVAAATGVSASYDSGDTVAIDGATYYAAGSTFTLSYTGTLQAASVFDGFSAKDANDQAVGTVSSDAASGYTLTLGSGDTTVSPAWAPAWYGAGDETLPYRITSTADLDLLAKMVNGQGGYGYSTFDGVYFQLAENITYTPAGNSTESNFTPIGFYATRTICNQFQGTFDGNFYTVSGTRIYMPGAGSTNDYLGLFGYVGAGGVVKNLILADAHVTGNNNVGGIAGKNEGTVTLCTVESNVLVAASSTNGNHHGGVVGWNEGTVTHCTVSATVSAASTDSICYGAVAGYSAGTVSNCLALGAAVPVLHNRYGVIVGGGTGPLTANYYRGCTVGDTANATGVGVGTSSGTGAPYDSEGAKSVHALDLGGNNDVFAPGEGVLIDGVYYYAAGSTVTLTFEPPEPDYALKTLTVTDASGNELPVDESYAFTMPAADVTVTAEFAPYYTITAVSNGGGTLDCPDGAFEGDTVTLTISPNTGYALDTLTVTDASNNEISVTDNAFILPASNVTVTAAFVQTEWATLNAQFASASTDSANPTLITLDQDYTAGPTDTCLTVPEGKYVTLDLNGHTLDRNMTAEAAGGGVIRVDGALTLKDDSTAGTGVITGGKTTGVGGGVYVSGTFEMTGGAITGNTAGSHGGGVYMYGSSASFTMTGGTIAGNAATYGGGVDHGGTFTMTGGTITGNTASSNGGGVYVSGTFDMTGGAISGNTASSNGGGVYIFRNSFTMRGGEITGNTAGSNGGGVYMVSNTSLKIAGGPVVTGNKKSGAANNVYLPTDAVINVIDALTDAARVGVTTAATPAASAPVALTSGLSGNGGAASFLSDKAGYAVGINGSGEAALAPVNNDSAQLSVLWIDGDDAEGWRPDSLTIHYRISGLTMAATVSADENGLWNATLRGIVALAKLTVDWDQIDNTPRTGDDATGYTYGNPENGYSCTVTGSAQAGFTVTMRHHPQSVVTAAGTVTWDDDNDINEVRPDSVTIHLWKNGGEVENTTVTSSGNWSYNFGNFQEYLPVTEDGAVVAYQRDVYTVKQDRQSHYRVDYDGFNITNTYVEQEYDCSVDSAIQHGTVTADLTEAAEGETVTLTVTPDSGYPLSSLTVTYEDANHEPQTVATTQGTGEHANEYTFAMPAADVTVTAVFARIYSVQISPNIQYGHGRVSANLASACEGQTVTLTVTPDAGYMLDILDVYYTYLDEDGDDVNVDVPSPRAQTPANSPSPCLPRTCTSGRRSRPRPRSSASRWSWAAS